MTVGWALFLLLLAASGCHAGSNRRKDSHSPSPSEETLLELAEAMGAAGFEHYTEGSARPIVKRLIPQNSEPDLDEVSYEGIVGKPGVDFPAFPGIPTTSFNCRNVATGYYADLETDCQVFHICDTNRKISFLCPNGTIFSQSHLICDWWFKVDCASAPALYETSAEQYSLAQRKAQKLPDLQQIDGERQQLRRPDTDPIIVADAVVSSTERHSKYRRPEVKTISRSSHSLVTETKPTTRPFESLPTSRSTAFEKRKKNLVQLISNNFAQTRTTHPAYTDSSTYRTTPSSDLGIKEMQIAAESASFANGNNRQFLQNFNTNNFKPYPVYSPTPNTRADKSTTPTYTTAFGRDFHSRNGKSSTSFPFITAITKRPTLIPYTKVYGNLLNPKHEPYTRPGVHLLKEFLDKEKNRTEKAELTNKSDAAVTKDTFESVTKIPITGREESYFTAAASSDRYDVFSNRELNQISTEPTYFNRRERLSKKLNLPVSGPDSNLDVEKSFGRRPGLVVPPSLTPKTLHSLAIYYATALDNLSTTTENDENKTTTLFPDHENLNNDELPALFSQATIEKYSKLFRMHAENSDLLQELKLNANGTNDLSEDLAIEQSQGSLSSNPQIRELAQVFTHALSAYLQDPVKFRKVLSDIRPTQPTFGDMMTTPSSYTDDIYGETTTYNEDEDEILGFSDDNKSKLPSLAQLRDAKIQTTTPVSYRLGKAIYDVTISPNNYPSESSTATTEYITTVKSPYRCCGSISASYTTASTRSPVTLKAIETTTAFNPIFNYTTPADYFAATTENSYTVPKYGGFQNNTSSFAPYGKFVQPANARPLNGEQYSEATNLPAEWGERTESLSTTTAKPVTNSIYDVNNLDKDISTTTKSVTTTGNYYSQFVTESESSELENEEELQRAQSQSFVSPNSNNNVHRHGKNIASFNEKKTYEVRKPSLDLELPSATVRYESSTTPQTTTNPFFPTTENYFDDEEKLSTYSPISETTTFDSVKINQHAQQWSNNFDNWHSTVILDPITLNDGLSAPKSTQESVVDYKFSTTQNYPTDQTYVSTTALPLNFIKNEYNINSDIHPIYRQNEQQINFASRKQKVAPPASLVQSYNSNLSFDPTAREGRLIKNPTIIDFNNESTKSNESMAEIAKEIMGGPLNETTADKLMNVMMKTKSKTVRRLILLLVQTCDDDHNKTAEASKKALLDALMAVSIKDTNESMTEPITLPTTTTEENNKLLNTRRRVDKISDFFPLQEARYKNAQRTGKSIKVDPSAVNSLKNFQTVVTSSPTTTTEATTTTSTTTIKASRRGVRKYLVRTSPIDTKVTSTTLKPIAEARVLSASDSKPTADARALELLRSLYSIAAKWG